ncbi:hypothetical protein IEO21_10110 [Rhodonia placenta]|uniref:Uncharacterized protein n=1 Tax=Rhodonia placenta TaxID=104341 RepID=A0A8H7NT29_9APHY|nr:hypothetical protein IEO21_10110 [Postia placenta]
MTRVGHVPVAPHSRANQSPCRALRHEQCHHGSCAAHPGSQWVQHTAEDNNSLGDGAVLQRVCVRVLPLPQDVHDPRRAEPAPCEPGA